MSRLRFFILPLLLGLIGGFLVLWASDVGLFVKWRPLPTDLLRPQKLIDLLGGNFDADGLPYVYVETDDGNSYSCQWPPPLLLINRCWIQTQSPHIGASDKGCENNLGGAARHRRFIISAPPDITTDRIRLEVCGASSSVYEYALLEDGTVWVWSLAPKHPLDMIGTAILILLGGCPGILVGLILSYVGRRWLQQYRK